MGDDTKEKRNRAEQKIKRAEHAAAMRARALAEYEDAAEARRAKTSKLRALRLAREAEERAAAADKAPPPKTVKR